MTYYPVLVEIILIFLNLITTLFSLMASLIKIRNLGFMKYLKFIFIIILIGSSACSEKDAVETKIELDGTYIGTFDRNGVTSNITLSFDAGQFVGTSDQQNFPAICNGNYSIKHDIIEISNDCAFTANFDWSLILDGTWEFNMQGNVLTLENDISDIYTLNKQ